MSSAEDKKGESEEMPMEQADDSSSKTAGSPSGDGSGGSGGGEIVKGQLPAAAAGGGGGGEEESQVQALEKQGGGQCDGETQSRTENNSTASEDAAPSDEARMEVDAVEAKDLSSSNGSAVGAGAGTAGGTVEGADESKREASGEVLPEDKGEVVGLKVMYNKKKYDVRIGVNSTVAELKTEIQTTTGVPPAMQKLMFKGLMKDDKTLSDLGVVSGSKLMLIGSTPKAVLEVTKPVAAGAAAASEEKASSSKEPLCKQKMHKKVLDRGKPDDVMIGIKNQNEALPNVPVSGMLNKAGGKVRLTFKLEVDQLWIGTKERTEKIHMNSIKNVLSEAIEGHEDYHIMAIQLGPTEASRYWIYWVPAQYAKAIKDTILGKWVYF